MQTYNERLDVLVARAKKEKEEKAAKKQEAYYKIKDQVFSELESAENLVNGITINFSIETIKTAFGEINEHDFSTKIQSEILNNHFHVTYHGLPDDKKCWRIYINYAR